MRPPLLLLLLPPLAFGQSPRPSVNDLTPLERQKSDFYGAIVDTGPRVEVAWSVSTSSVELGGDLTLTFTVRHAVNPHELIRPPLADRDEFRQLFSVIEDMTGPPGDPTATRVEFRYRVRPRNTGKFWIPEWKYGFFRKSAGQTRFHTSYAEKLPFTVTKPPVKPSAAVPVDGPLRFFELRSNGPFARSSGPSAAWWVGLFGGAAILTAGWVFGWRMLFPDAIRLAKIRRHRAVRIALDQLRRAAKATDPTAATAAAFRGYLTARFGVPSSAQTPPEVTDSLRQLGFDETRVNAAEVLLRNCDAARFAGANDAAVSPRAAIELIERWEGVRM
jgi:hypothetical protein